MRFLGSVILSDLFGSARNGMRNAESHLMQNFGQVRLEDDNLYLPAETLHLQNDMDSSMLSGIMGYITLVNVKMWVVQIFLTLLTLGLLFF